MVHEPVTLQLLIVNHSAHALPALQLQMRRRIVAGRSFQNLAALPPHGGSTVARVQWVPLAAGLTTMDGCTVVDLQSGREYHQPPLCVMFVDDSNNSNNSNNNNNNNGAAAIETQGENPTVTAVEAV